MSQWEERKEKTLPEKVKDFFRFPKSGSPNQPMQLKAKQEKYLLSKDKIKELGPENTLAVRIKAMKDLFETVLNKHLEDKTLEALVVNTEDLVSPQQSLEARHTVLKFYRCLIQGQFERLDDVRAYFFRVLKNHTVLEDLPFRLELFKALTDSGKKVIYFEEETGPFLLEWMPAVISSGKTRDFLVILVNFIKYNAAYLDSEVITGFIQHACVLSGRTRSGDDIFLCLDMLDALICYSYIPAEVLPHFIISLCRTVNIEKYSQKSWKVMKNYLGTSMGQSGIFTICWLIQDRNHMSDYAFLRGAIFFLHLALWSDKKVTTLSPLLSAVLPSLLQSLDSQQGHVAFEVNICLQNLINFDRSQLQDVSWEILLRIIDRLLANPDVLCGSTTQLGEQVHETLTTIEGLYKNKLYNGSPEQLFNLINRYASRRPEHSVIMLIDYRSKFIFPKYGDWIDKLNGLLERYFKCDTRSTIRVKVLNILEEVVQQYRHLYEKEFIEQCVLKFLSNINIDPDLHARNVATRFLIDLAVDCHTSRCMDLLEIIGKVLCRQFVPAHSNLNREPADTLKVVSDEEVADIKIAAEGLIRIFKKRLNIGPPLHGFHAFHLLVSYLEAHYSFQGDYDQVPMIRKIIMQFLLSLRANESGRLWVANVNGPARLSTNMFCALDHRDSRSVYTASPTLISPTNPSTSPSVTYDLNFKPAFETIIACLKEENNWPIMLLVLQELPKLLSNKAIIICGRSNLTNLTTTLCTLVSNPILERLEQLPPKYTKLDFQMLIYPILAKLTAYHSEIHSRVQRILVNTLQQGLVSKCVRSCIVALTLCTLQMQDIMYKLLPDILLRLSKISATVSIAMPVLEFLSNLIRHPRLYKSFVEDQYISIFAIALPYTNPSKFQQYTVALAHHVIAMWFIKCRQPFRKDSTRYIMKVLRANTVVPVEEPVHHLPAPVHALSEGAQRQRSGSLHDAYTKRLEWGHRSNSLVPSNSLNSSDKAKSNKSIRALHQELLETCLDLFARYCFNTQMPLPKRDDLTEFLMKNGMSESWLLGSALYTITTSSPGSNMYKDGLCRECYMTCHPDHVPELDPFENPITERKRHKSEIQSSSRDRSSFQPLLTKDDLLLHQNLEPKLPVTSKVEEAKDLGTKKNEPRICNCWCPGWAEILVRRPTGNYSSLIRIQHSTMDFPVPDFKNWFNDNGTTGDPVLIDMETISTEPKAPLPEEIQPTPTGDSTCILEVGKEDPSQCDRSPLRRTSSSPDMQGVIGWTPQQHSPHFHSASPPSSPPPCKGYESAPQTKSKSSPSSPVARQSYLKQCVSEDYSSSSAYSPRKEPDNCKTIPEEREGVGSGVRDRSGGGRVKLKLDLSGVSNSSSSQDSRSSSPPSTAPVKSKGPPRSPFFKRGSISPPPSSSRSASFLRDRTHTISVVSPVSPSSKRSPVRSASFASRGTGQSPTRDSNNHRPVLHPSFVFLQLMQTSFPAGSEPLLLPKKETIERAVYVLDHIPPYETHKIGVVYIGPNQVNNEAAFLQNRCGSVRYKDFLFGLGTFLELSQVDPRFTYVGGLDLKGQDGKYACNWQDDFMQVIFHVATLIPNRESDQAANHKKAHIGNDFVTIVYNNSGVEFQMSTLKGQFAYVCIIVEPGDFGTSSVSIKAKTELAELFGHLGPSLIADEFLPIYVRQLALHANLSSVVSSREQSKSDPYVTNWLERLRQLKRLKEKIEQELRGDEDEFGDSPKQTKDFTAYV